MLIALKYLLTALFIWGVGTLFFANTTHFRAQSQVAELVVREVQSRRDADGDLMYRPVFALNAPGAEQAEYAGNSWSGTPRHEPGEVVSGRHNPATGEMRSDKMM